MEKIGVFYGSTTGNCETVANIIRQELGIDQVDIHDIAIIEPETLNHYSNYIFGISTWGIGDLQDDWIDFIDQLDRVDFTRKVVALYGLGDQDTYADSFVDGLGLLYKKLISKPLKLIGRWPTDGYEFQHSKAIENNSFIGLIIDEDTQPELTEPRIKKWVNMIRNEFN